MNVTHLEVGFYTLKNKRSENISDFDEFIGEDTDKKRLVKALTRIFAILLKTKVDTTHKIKKNT